MGLELASSAGVSFSLQHRGPKLRYPGRCAMKQLVVLSMLVALALPWVSFAQAPPQQTILPEGTPIRMRMNRTVSSADAQVGDNVDFETLDDVNLGEMVVIPKGSMAMATVTE